MTNATTASTTFMCSRKSHYVRKQFFARTFVRRPVICWLGFDSGVGDFFFFFFVNKFFHLK